MNVPLGFNDRTTSPAFSRQRGDQILIERNILAGDIHAAGEFRPRMLKAASDRQRLAGGVGRQISVQLIVFQHQRSAHAIQAIRKFVIRDCYVEAIHRHFRPPTLAIEIQFHIPADFAGRLEPLPFGQ